MRKVLHILNVAILLLLFGGTLSAQNIADSSACAEKSSKYEVIVSPNPFDDEVILSVNHGNKNLTFIRIFDLIGKEVAFIDLRSKSRMNVYKLNFSALSPGVYFCNIYGPDGVIETKKLFRTK